MCVLGGWGGGGGGEGLHLLPTCVCECVEEAVLLATCVCVCVGKGEATSPSHLCVCDGARAGLMLVRRGGVESGELRGKYTVSDHCFEKNGRIRIEPAHDTDVQVGSLFQ